MLQRDIFPGPPPSATMGRWSTRTSNCPSRTPRTGPGRCTTGARSAGWRLGTSRSARSPTSRTLLPGSGWRSWRATPPPRCAPGRTPACGRPRSTPRTSATSGACSSPASTSCSPRTPRRSRTGTRMRRRRRGRLLHLDPRHLAPAVGVSLGGVRRPPARGATRRGAAPRHPLQRLGVHHPDPGPVLPARRRAPPPRRRPPVGNVDGPWQLPAKSLRAGSLAYPDVRSRPGVERPPGSLP